MRIRKEKMSGRKKFTPAAADIVNPPPDSLKYANKVDTTNVFENSASVDDVIVSILLNGYVDMYVL